VLLLIHPLGDDALQIWRSGVAAVDSRLLVRGAGNQLRVGNEAHDLQRVRRILVVGAGKSGACMAAGLEEVRGPEILRARRLTGWLNALAECVTALSAVHVHAARQPGQNEPTPEGALGAEETLRLVAEATTDDLCLAFVSGGASVLLPWPAPGISLAATRHLSAAGADIRRVNTVGKPISRINGGGSRRACPAGHLIAVVISDVIGDSLDVIGSRAAGSATRRRRPTPWRSWNRFMLGRLASRLLWSTTCVVVQPRLASAAAVGSATRTVQPAPPARIIARKPALMGSAIVGQAWLTKS
jgi:glycerate-2-kinase